MSQNGSGKDTGHVTPEEIFEALGHEDRVEILTEFIQHTQAQLEEGTYTEPKLTFSELWERSGIKDSSRFNYHLGHLVGIFIEETDELYRLSHLGRQFIGTLYRWADQPGAGADQFTIEVPGVCHSCDSRSLQAEFSTDNRILISCVSCGNQIAGSELPPGAVADRSPEGVIDVYNRLMRANVLLATGHICPVCLGPMTSGITTEFPAEWGFEALPYYECRRCHKAIWPTFADVLLFHPEVRAFCYRNDIDPLASPFWTLELIVSNQRTSIRSEDPWEVEVELHTESESLTAVLDGDLEVVGIDIT